MKKNNDILKILTVLFVFLLTMTFLSKQFTLSYDKNMTAMTVQEMENQLKIIRAQAENILSKLFNLEAGDDKLDTTPPILSNLEPEHVTNNSGIITWGSNELSNSQVNYSEEFMRKDMPKGTLVTMDPKLTTHHEIQLTSLKPNTMYYYYVSSIDPSGNRSVSNIHTIKTLSY